jgi:hypothetical protein
VADWGCVLLTRCLKRHCINLLLHDGQILLHSCCVSPCAAAACNSLAKLLAAAVHAFGVLEQQLSLSCAEL